MSKKEKSVVLLADMLSAESCCEMWERDSFSLPPEELRQKDLQYIAAVFVSSGMNLNGAVFLPSELIQARDTMLKKALDVEHLEGYVVGHIYDRAFMLQDGTLVDPINLLVDSGNKINSTDLDVAIAMALYKYRFPEIAEEVEEGKYKVSMECYYRDFDIKIGDIIISKDEASKLGVKYDGDDSLVGSNVKITEGTKEIGSASIGRVFRDIIFSGCGLVENPANIRSEVIEVASTSFKRKFARGITIDLSKSETYMKDKQERESIVIQSDDNTNSDNLDNKETAGGSTGGSSSTEVGYCVSYKKYVYEYRQGDDVVYSEEKHPHITHPAGVGDNPNPDDVIIHENWCKLFDTECTSVGADATYPLCLRNVLDRATNEAIDDYEELLEVNRRDKFDWDEYRRVKKEALTAIEKSRDVVVDISKKSRQ